MSDDVREKLLFVIAMGLGMLISQIISPPTLPRDWVEYRTADGVRHVRNIADLPGEAKLDAPVDKE